MFILIVLIVAKQLRRMIYRYRMKAYPETHQQGFITIENPHIHSMVGDLGVQIAADGRIWICIDGISFLRFSPHPNGKMKKGQDSQ